MSILVTGGTGYIGSHTTVELLEQGYDVIIVDNLSNSSKDVIASIKEITGKTISAYQVDLLDEQALNIVFEENNIEAVMHFAGFKAVAESVENPLKYYSNNVVGTLNLCTVMSKHNVTKLIFSSSATVYGMPETLPVAENASTSALNPYGQTKLMCEEILKDLSNTDSRWKIASLRYFNPVGAHASAKIGEKPNGVPANLMPYITQVASGRLKELTVHGNDYPTKDGTGIRDYIHVVDLAKGHIAALQCLDNITGFDAFNLGTGQGYSVLEVIETFENEIGVKIPYTIKQRRLGDAALSYADPEKANKKLNWKAEKILNDMCKDAWSWEKVRLVLTNIN